MRSSGARRQAHQRWPPLWRPGRGERRPSPRSPTTGWRRCPRATPRRRPRRRRAAADGRWPCWPSRTRPLLLQRARARRWREPPAPDRRALCELQLLDGTGLDARGGRGARARRLRGRRRRGAAAGGGDLLARAALGYGAELMLAQTDPTLVALLEEALAVLPPGPSGWRAQVLARLAAALQPARRRERADGAWRARRSRWRAGMGDPTHPAHRCCWPAGSALADYAPSGRAGRRQRGAGAAGARGRRPLPDDARGVAPGVRLPRAGRDRAQRERAIERYEAVAREFRQARHIWPGRLMRAMLASAQGRFAEAARLFDEARALAESDADVPRPLRASPGAAWATRSRASGRRSCRGPRRTCSKVLRDPERRRPIPAACIHMLGGHDRARALGDLEAVRQRLALVPLERPALCSRRHRPTPCWPSRWPGRRRRAGWREVHPYGCCPWPAGWSATAASGMSCAGPVDVGAGHPGQRARTARRGRRATSRRRGARPARRAAAVPARRPVLVRAPAAGARATRRRRRARALLAEARALAEALGLAILAERLDRLEASRRRARRRRRAGPGPWRGAGGAGVLLRARGRVLDGQRGRRRLPPEGQPRACRCWPSWWPTRAASSTCWRCRAARATERRWRGDAGEVLDAEAIAEYRARVEELDEEIAEAESWGDAARAGARPRGARGHRPRAGPGRGPGRPRAPGGRRRRTRAHQRPAPHPRRHPQDRRGASPPWAPTSTAPCAPAPSAATSRCERRARNIVPPASHAPRWRRDHADPHDDQQRSRGQPGARLGALWAAAWQSMPESIAPHVGRRRLRAGGGVRHRAWPAWPWPRRFPGRRSWATTRTRRPSTGRASWPAPPRLEAPGALRRRRFARLPRAAYRPGHRRGSAARAPAIRARVLNAIRNALVPDGACLLLEPPRPPPIAVPAPGLSASADLDLQSLAWQTGFSRFRPVPSEGYLRLFELRR